MEPHLIIKNQPHQNYKNHPSLEAPSSIEINIKKSEPGTSKKLGRLKAKIVNPHKLSQASVQKMFQLMKEYYDFMNFETFRADLLEKEGVILLLHKKEKTIEGFSTFKYIEKIVNGKRVRGLFSGDTVINKLYWRQKVLGKAFLKHLLLMKMKNPFRPYYWFLISKGYKTYLLLSNNFGTHYPRYEVQTPKNYQDIIDQVYTDLFPELYDQELGLVRGRDQSCRLKEDVTPISPALLATHPRIAYFEYANPHWANGDELACISKMTLWMPLYYQFKFIKRKMSEKFKII